MPIFKKNRSPSYSFTIRLDDPEDMAFLAKIREVTSLHNRHGLWPDGKKWNVKLKYRLGSPQNPMRDMYRKGGKKYFQMRRGQIDRSDAQYADVYMHERRASFQQVPFWKMMGWPQIV